MLENERGSTPATPLLHRGRSGFRHAEGGGARHVLVCAVNRQINEVCHTVIHTFTAETRRAAHPCGAGVNRVSGLRGKTGMIALADRRGVASGSKRSQSASAFRLFRRQHKLSFSRRPSDPAPPKVSGLKLTRALLCFQGNISGKPVGGRHSGVHIEWRARSC